MVDVVRVKLTQSLNLVTDDVVDEATYSISKWFGDSQEWRTFPVKQAMLDIVARVSTRVFAGVELARNEVRVKKQMPIQLGGKRQMTDTRD